MTKKYAFCHGWTIDQSYNEVTCRRRESCAYYDVDFYRHHGHHLDEFEEMFPTEPCPFFLSKMCDVKKEEDVDVDVFSLMGGA